MIPLLPLRRPIRNLGYSGSCSVVLGNGALAGLLLLTKTHLALSRWRCTSIISFWRTVVNFESDTSTDTFCRNKHIIHWSSIDREGRPELYLKYSQRSVRLQSNSPVSLLVHESTIAEDYEATFS